MLMGARRRYLAKGNYNVTRTRLSLEAVSRCPLHRAVREPRWHVKQHRLFSAAEQADPRILRHMRRVRHFEFGLDRRVINTAIMRQQPGSMRSGPQAGMSRAMPGSGPGSMVSCSTASRPIRPLLKRPSWSATRRRARTRKPRLPRLPAHAKLSFPRDAIAAMAGEISSPTYYDSGFTPADEATIRDLIGTTAQRLGYVICPERRPWRRASTPGIRRWHRGAAERLWRDGWAMRK
jgi:hypothetical protein